MTLHFEGEGECIVHVRGLFEAPCALEPAGRGVVGWASDPSDSVGCVECDAFVAVCSGKELYVCVCERGERRRGGGGTSTHAEAIVVDEDG